ncbi:MAG: hypothetical protein M3R35_02080 [Candidatus Eremiobacteraeota bacterium]|nr:hypothetical protein [Candidatus Eremiobacteraeota bacterium]
MDAPASPIVDTLDANLRSSGNDRATAIAIGKSIFRTEWPAQVLKVYADQFESHRVAGLDVSGVKFHAPLDRARFFAEVRSLAAAVFASSPVEEVDIWATVPLSVGKGIVVSGDLARPTNRTVFTVSVLRGESSAALASRLRARRAVFLDEEWASTALK